MLPEKYSFDLGPEQNYYGDTFSFHDFVYGIVAQFPADQREQNTVTVTNVTQAITDKIEQAAGRDLSRVGDILEELTTETEGKLRPEVLAAEAEELGGDPDLLSRRRVILETQFAVLTLLKYRRDREALSQDTTPQPGSLGAEVQERASGEIGDLLRRLAGGFGAGDQ
jgi:hypothetical protein